MTADRVLPAPLTDIGFSTVGKLWTPWCLALSDGEVASIAETVRIGAAGAEVGVNTVPDRRGRGLAAAATAGWARSPSLEGLTRFYSTSVTNRSSQRVAERLGLHVLGASFSVS
jgi:predicted GNAT family acetyltransferase